MKKETGEQPISLLEIENELLVLAERIEALEQQRSPADEPDRVERELMDARQTLVAYLQARGSKIDRTVALILRLENDAKYMREQVRRVEARARSKEGVVKRIKGFLLYAMKTFAVERLDGPLSAVVLCAGKKGLARIADEKLLPPEFWMVPPPVPDMEAIRAAVAKGTDIPGVKVEAGEDYLRIS